jgi:hypothetical protein
MKLNNNSALDIIRSNTSVDVILRKHKTQAHIAILMKRGKVLEVASNSIGTRSKGAGYADRTIHAERAVLKKIGNVAKLDGAILIVIRIMKGTKDIGNSAPCHSCRCHLEKCMKKHGLKTVYYST